MSSSWIGRVGAAAAAITVAAAGVVALGGPAGAQTGEDPVEACRALTGVPEVGRRACKSVEAGTWLAAQHCRRVPSAGPGCETVDGRQVGEEAMAAFEASWTARALDLQRGLDLDVPLVAALLPHTHNSANSAAYAPSVSTLDANQVVTLTDQLRLGIRAVEIDVHWTPHPAGDPQQGFREAVQCHGEPVATPAGVVHAGCSIDRTLDENLRELRAWLDDPANADELVLLYLENALDGDEAAHARAVAVIDDVLGDLVFRPTAGAGCQDLPVGTESKASILATGARVLLTGNCGPAGWTDWVYQRGPAWDESGSTSDYGCEADRAGTDYATTFVRRYEDSTWLSTMAGGGSHITADVLADMVGCGVNLPGLDQVHPGDERLGSLVWSWRVDEPAVETVGACAAQDVDGRWFADGCEAVRPAACRTTDGGWAVTAEPVAWGDIEAACRESGHAGAGAPANAWENRRLRTAAGDAGGGDVWLAHAQDQEGAWRTGAPAPTGEDPPPRDRPGRGRPGRGHGTRPPEPGPPAQSGPATVTVEPTSTAGPRATAWTLALATVAAAGGAAATRLVRRRRGARRPG